MIRQILVALISALFLPSLHAPEYRPVRIVVAPSYVVSAVARSIARHEGANALGALPQRLNNPGALLFAGQPGATRDASGYARFTREELGYRALRRQIELRFARGLKLSEVLSIWADGAYLPQVLKETRLSPEVRLP